MSDVESAAGVREFKVEGTPDHIVSMIHGYFESEEWPHRDRSQVYKGVMSGSNKVICRVNDGYILRAVLVWLSLFVITLSLAFFLWLVWMLLTAGGDRRPAVSVAVYPESALLSRLTVSSKKKPEYAEPIIEWIQRELVEKRRAADSLQDPQPIDNEDDIAAQIRELGEPRDAGLLTAEEFERKKAELLDRM